MNFAENKKLGLFMVVVLVYLATHLLILVKILNALTKQVNKIQLHYLRRKRNSNRF